VARLADDVVAAADRVEVVIHNGAIPGPPQRTVTDDSNELTLQVNYLAPVALTKLLLDRPAGAEPVRIVNVASATHLSANLDLDDPDLSATTPL
jgi:NAD(P)-dependent dehydrogenase (short-subunit alcohol dehydrogenase family)